MKHNMNSRLLAWLLTLVMVLNIFPVSAFAGSDVDYETLDAPPMGQRLTPSEDQYVVRYVVEGEYTYDGKDVFLENDTVGRSSLTALKNDQQNKVNDEKNNNIYKSKYEKLGRWLDKYYFDEQNRVLTLYFEPSSEQVNLRYYVFYYEGEGENKKINKRDFGSLEGQNNKAGLQKSPNETINIGDFVKSINNNKSGPNIDLNNVEGLNKGKTQSSIWVMLTMLINPLIS